jgi:hypothetical protein
MWNPKPTHFQACRDLLLGHQSSLLFCTTIHLIGPEESEYSLSILRYSWEFSLQAESSPPMPG